MKRNTYYTDKAAATVVNSLLKETRKGPRAAMFEPHTVDGMMIATDGFRLYRLRKEPEGIKPFEPSTRGNKDYADFFKRLVKNVLKPVVNAVARGEYKELTVPSAEGVKNVIARARDEKINCPIYNFGAGLPAVNAKYLLELMKLFPFDVHLYYDPTPGSVKPLYIEAEEGDAILLPIRKLEIKPAEPVKPAEAAVKAGKTMQGEEKAEQQARENVEEIRKQIANDLRGSKQEKKPVDDPAEPAEPAKQERAAVPEKTFVGQALTGSGWKILFDADKQRTRILIDVPNDASKAVMQELGFYWSPNMKSFNKKLSWKAYRAAKVVAERLTAIYGEYLPF